MFVQILNNIILLENYSDAQDVFISIKFLIFIKDPKKCINIDKAGEILYYHVTIHNIKNVNYLKTVILKYRSNLI